MLTAWHRAGREHRHVCAWRELYFGGALMRSRGTGLAQGLGAGEAVVLQALADDARHGRVLVERALEHAKARRVADEAEIGHRHAIAVAIGAGRLVAGEMHLV